jgi:alpha-L-fucosidase
VSTIGFPTVWRTSTTTQPAPTQPDSADDDLAARLKWFQEARFGMFIHWGLYAIPAGTWNGQKIKGTGEWIMLNAKISPEDYETLAPQFNPVAFNAEHWMALAADAGMKYVVTTTKHHDGFCLFDSAFTNYDIMDATPFRRDIMKEIADAARKNNLRLGWYHSILDWHHPDAKGERFPAYEKVLHNQVEEILTKYGNVDVVWFDGEWLEEWTPERGQKLYDHCRGLAPQALINNRVGKGRDGMAGLTTAGHKLGDFGTPEQEVPAGTVLDEAWESCMTMNETWGFRSDDPNFKSSAQLIRTLIETVSKGGNFLLNVGPTAEGRIPPESIERLRDIGTWMKVNGESIYGKTASPLRKSPFGRCTFGDGALYVHLFDLPAAQGEREILLPGLRANFKSAVFLANPKLTAKVQQEKDGVKLSFSQWPVDKSAVVIKLALQDPSEPLLVEETPLVQPASGPFVLQAFQATISGKGARYEPGLNKQCIGFWYDLATSVSWDTRLVKPGKYSVQLGLACEPGSEDSQVDVEVQGKVFKVRVPVTKGWSDFITLDLGTIEAAAGNCEIRVRPVAKARGAIMNLRSVTLVPVAD